VFQERAGDVREVVGAILDDALDLDAPAATRRAARTALLPWLDQALGRPKESVEITLPGTVEEIDSMDYSALLAARDALRQAGASA
jgi:AAA+ superfamily predicted ATPase